MVFRMYMDQLPGEELLKKMWNTLADKGIAGWLEPWQIRRVGRAITDIKTEAILRIAQAEKEAAAISNGQATLTTNSTLKLTYQKESSKPTESENTTSFLETIERTQITDIARKEINVAKAIIQAEAILEEATERANNEAIDEDWLYRWRNLAGDVSAEELQYLWGKILAGEVKAPGSFSLRTLEFLKTTSTKDAEQISLLAPFIINNDILYRDNKLLEKYAITYGFLLKMQEFGILNGVEAIGGLKNKYPSVEQDTFLLPLICYNKVLLVEHDTASSLLEIDSYILTSVGKEIMKLCDKTPNETYLKEVGQYIIKKGFKIKIAPYVRVSDNQIRYSDQEVVELSKEVDEPN